MYYDLNPSKRLGEIEYNIYANLIKWIDNHPGCVVNDIRIHLELRVKDKEKREEEEREKYKYNGQTKEH